MTMDAETLNDKAGGNPLASLANEAANMPGPGNGDTDLDVAERAAQNNAQAQAAAAAQAAMMAGVQQFLLGALRAIRARVAKSLPEINDEWTDEALAGPAAAAVPVLNKWAAKWMPLLGDYPEEAALLMSTLPLVMGYIAAIDKHAKVITATPAAE